ncbi:MAG TPA: hypothetical protein VF241_11250 [Propionibacteriaceae bacterium]
MTGNAHRGARVNGIQDFAVIMLIIGGAFQAIEAIAALLSDKYILVLSAVQGFGDGGFIDRLVRGLPKWLQLIVGVVSTTRSS